MIATLVSLVAIHACDQSGGNASLPPAKGTGTRTGTGATDGSSLTAVTYESWVKDYFAKACVKCHSSKSQEAFDLSSYAAVRDTAEDSLASMKAGRMPPNQKASKDQIDKMQAWIKGGKLEKKAATGASSSAARPGLGNGTGSRTTSPTPGGTTNNPPASSSLTWDKDILPIFRSSCGLASNGCHSTQARFGDLTTLQAAKRYVSGIKNRVNSGDMPRGQRLSDGDKQKIINWTNQGAN